MADAREVPLVRPTFAPRLRHDRMFTGAPQTVQPMTSMRRISIVAPFYNKGESVSHFRDALCSVLDRLPDFEMEVVCVDDGSRDDTLARLVVRSEEHTYEIQSLMRDSYA